MTNSVAKVVLGAATLIALAAGGGRYAQAATANINMEARILGTGLVITETAALSFGTLLEPSAGNVIIQTDGTVAGTVTPIGGTTQVGGFRIRGINGQFAEFVMPGSAVLSNGTGKTMVVDSFKIGTGSDDPNTFTMKLNGTFQTGIPVGGQLHVNALQALGTYTGAVTLTADYQ